MGRSLAGIERLVLDGGILTEWFQQRYVALGRHWPARFQPHVLRTPQDLKIWEKALKRYPGKLYMSAYAIAEVQRHVRDGEKGEAVRVGEFRRNCWGTVQRALTDYPIHERHIQWTALDTRLLHDYGPADASLIALAQELTRDGQQPCIIARDGPLRLRCRQSDLGLGERDPAEILEAMRA